MSLIKLRNLDIFLIFLSSLDIGKCPSYQNPNDGWVHMERVFIVKVLASLEFSSTSLAKWGFITSMGRSSQLEDSLGSMELSPRHLLYAGFFCYAGFWVRFSNSSTMEFSWNNSKIEELEIADTCQHSWNQFFLKYVSVLCRSMIYPLFFHSYFTFVWRIIFSVVNSWNLSSLEKS